MSRSTSSSPPFQCVVCKVNLASSPLWLDHLATDLHQVTLRKISVALRNGGDIAHWDRRRTIHILGIERCSTKDVLSYIHTWGDVEDFSYVKNPKKPVTACYALLRSRNAAARIIMCTGGHEISGKKVIIKKKGLKQYVKRAIQFSIPTLGMWGGSGSAVDVVGNEAQEGAVGFGGIDKGGMCTEGCMHDQGHCCGTRPVVVTPVEIVSSAGKKKYECKTCNCSALWTRKEWEDHLCCDGHQKMLRQQMGLKRWESRKSVRINGINGIKKRELLNWALNWGDVVNLFYDCKHDGEAEVAFLLFSAEESVNDILTLKEYQIINDRKIEVKMMDELIGYTKKEKQLIRAQKLTDEIMEIGPTAEISLNAKEIVANELAELYKMCEAIQSPEKQLEVLLDRISWNQTELEQVYKYITQELCPLMKSQSHPLNNCSIQVVKYPSTRFTGEKDPIPNILVLLNLQTDEFDMTQFSKKCQFAHQLLHCIKSLILYSPVSQPKPTDIQIIPVHNFSEHETQPGVVCSLSSHEKRGPWAKVTLQPCLSCLAYQECHLINYCVSLDPRIPILLKILSHWNQLRGKLFSAEELFPNHIMSLMLLFFLQDKKIIPTIHSMCNSSSKPSPLVFQGFDTSFSTDCNFKSNISCLLTDKLLMAYSVLSLLKEFFTFYGHLNYDDNVFCTRLGRLIPKDSFLNPERLPEEIRYLYIKSGKELSTTNTVVMQDPFILNVNLSQSRGKAMYHKFRAKACYNGKLLEKAISLEKPSFKDIFQINPCITKEWINTEESTTLTEPSVKTLPNEHSIIIVE